jgi:exosortase/archaeosortase family protein
LVAGFILRLLLAWGAAWALVALVPSIQAATVTATAWSFARALAAVRLEVAQSGSSVEAAGVSLEIVPECTPLVPILLLIGAIAAYPASLRARAAGLALGAAGLWAFNLLRLVTLLFILARAPRWFDFAHVYLWQTVSVLAAAAAFALWVRATGGRG